MAKGTPPGVPRIHGGGGGISAYDRLLAIEWLKMYMGGMSINKIAKVTHYNQRTITKYMSKAAEQLLEDSKEQVIKELLPLAIKVYQAAMQQQIAAADGDKAPAHEIKTTHADRILKGMFIIDHQPAPTQQLREGASEEGIETLSAFMVKRPAKQIAQPAAPPAIEATATVEEAIDGEKVNADEQP